MMRTIQKWTLGIISGFSETLGELENHEAVTSAALADMRRHLARAQVRARYLRTHYQRLSDEAGKAERDSDAWKRRATLEEDESRALECLRRSRTCRRRAEQLKARSEEGRQEVEEIERTVRTQEERYGELLGRHKLYQAREAASKATSSGEIQGLEQIEDAFERWEVKIAERQPFPSEQDEQVDPFVEQYEREEEELSLRDELSHLRREGSDK